MNGLANRQRGLVLILSLIMLVVLTLLAVSAIRLSTVNLRTVANAQSRSEALSTAQRTIDMLLSSNFTTNIAGTAATVTVAEGGKNYTVVIARPCLVRSVPVLNTALPEPDVTGKACVAGVGASHYPECTCSQGNSIYSQCSDTIWQLQATSSSGWFGANVSITQGTGIRMDNGQVTAYANDASYRCTSI